MNGSMAAYIAQPRFAQTFGIEQPTAVKQTRGKAIQRRRLEYSLPMCDAVGRLPALRRL